MQTDKNVIPEFAKARTQLLMGGTRAAFYGALLMSLKPVLDSKIQTAATDGVSLFYNPDYFRKLTERQRVGLLVHEVRHPMGLHHTRRNGRDLKRWNRACDYAINCGIVADGFELPDGALLRDDFAGLAAGEIYRRLLVEEQEKENEKPQTPPPPQNPDESEENESGQGDSDETESDENESSENDESENNDSDSENGESESDENGQGDSDQSDENSDSDESGNGAANGESESDETDSEGNAGGSAGKSENESANESGRPNGTDDIDSGMCGGIIDAAPAHDESANAKAEQAMQEKVRQAIATARRIGQGKLPADLERLVGELNQPTINTRDLVRRFIDQSCTKTPSWNRPNKRYVGARLTLPSMVSDRPAHIVGIVDVSSSVLDSDVLQFVSELQGALDSGAADMVSVLFANTAVVKADSYQPGEIIPQEFPVGGGTSFRQPFEYVAENYPDASGILYLTDCEIFSPGDWGVEPESCGVLWIVTGEPQNARRFAANAPFGEPVILQD